jgi:hypothetical protein
MVDAFDGHLGKFVSEAMIAPVVAFTCQTLVIRRLTQGIFEIVSDIDLAVVALGRVVDMAAEVGQVTRAPVTIPDPLVEISASSRRDPQRLRAYDDRARGRIRERPHPDALSIFDWTTLFQEGVVRTTVRTSFRWTNTSSCSQRRGRS